MVEMSALPYTLEFRGSATPLDPGVLIMRGRAPSALFTEGGEALLEARVSLLDGEAFELAGTVSFGRGTALRFHSIRRGAIGPWPEPGLRLGTAVCDIDGGSGRLASASGRMTSSFLVSDTGELTDHQLGLLFVPPRTAKEKS
jgi:hypothetical protein